MSIKKTITTVFFFFFEILILQAQTAPTAEFTASPVVGNTIPHTVFFTDESVIPDTWLWNFGDGGTSTAKNPIHTYTNFGAFTVRLTIQDTITGVSDFENKVAYIKISAPVADIGGPSLGYFGCGPLTPNFVDASVANGAPIVSWLWNFGDGSTSTDQNPSHTYATSGSYTVSLTVTDSFGNSNSDVFNNMVQVIGPNPNFQANQTLIQSNTSVAFTNLSTSGAPITSWIWDFGDGSPTSTTQNPSHTYTASGNYTVSLTVSDLDGCSKTLTKTAYIKAVACPENSTVNNDAGQCEANVVLPDFEGYTNGNAIQLDGINDHITAPLPTVFNTIGTNDFTVEMWVNRASSTNTSRLFFAQLNSDNFVSSLVSLSGVLYIFIEDNSNVYSVNTQNVIPLNQWTHITFRWNATSKIITVLINGVELQNTVSGGSSTMGNDNRMTIGCRTDGNQVFKGKIDEVRIWNQERSNAAIVASMYTCVSEADANLVAYYHLDEDSGDSSVYDATGNGYDGTLVNSNTATAWIYGTISCDVSVTNDFTNTNNASGVYPIGDTTVTWTASNTTGNTVTCTQIVTVVDNEIPVITCPSAITINTDLGQCTSNTSIGVATATDNCGVPTVSNDAPTAFPIGDTTVTWIATDTAGNTATCTQIVTVVDNENPVITCPSAITINTDLGQCTSSTSIGVATATDNCGVPTVSNDAPTAFPIGDTTVTWTATDSAGNTATCTQIVTVVDNENPVITCPSAITINTDLGQCTATTSIGVATATDNCGVPTVSDDAPTAFPIGDTTVTWAATDTAGNTATCTQIITVVDNENPVITCPSAITINTDLGQCTSTTSIGVATATDNCGVPTVSNDAPTTFSIGDTTVTWTATDTAGNTATCTQIVTVVDTENPEVVTQDIVVSLDASGNVSITPSMINNGSSDNCTITSFSLDKTSFDCSDIGTPILVTLTVTDASGNLNNATAFVTVEDNTNPIVSTQDITVSLDNSGNATITPEMIDNGSYDTCGVESISLNTTNFNCPRLDEVQLVSLTVTDNNGNSSTAVAYVSFTGFDLDLDNIADSCDTELNPDITPILGISPNNDGENDTWVIENITNFPKAKIEVFDRNGVAVYDAINYQNNWAGNRNGSGELVPVGSYYFSINIFGDGSLFIKGWLYINY
ncbi:PKD domain-containing protein [Flavobacterium sp. HNIBRBA15423]|uniref:PKD domain-containing protein n=1 Tax=Flavobacterium sp. HNIBRBA15423 TaxID=3458683 RepID=UPI00404431F3